MTYWRAPFVFAIISWVANEFTVRFLLCRRAPNETNDQAKQEIVQNTDSNKWPSLEQILQRLGLENFILTFQLEQIDGEALVGFVKEGES